MRRWIRIKNHLRMWRTFQTNATDGVEDDNLCATGNIKMLFVYKYSTVSRDPNICQLLRMCKDVLIFP